MEKKDKRLDIYSMMIVMKYFQSKEDYINGILVCKKYEEILEMFRYNPIEYKRKENGKLFPRIQTQYLYSSFDERKEGIERFVYMYNIQYSEYKKNERRRKKKSTIYQNNIR